MRVFVIIIVLLGLGAGLAWWLAGRSEPPTIQIVRAELVMNVRWPE